MEARTKYAKTGDYNIAYQVVGDGPIDLVLSPGAATHLELAWKFHRSRAFWIACPRSRA